MFASDCRLCGAGQCVDQARARLQYKAGRIVIAPAVGGTLGRLCLKGDRRFAGRPRDVLSNAHCTRKRLCVFKFKFMWRHQE